MNFKKSIKKIAKGIGFGFAGIPLYIASLVGVNYLEDIGAKKINSESELENYIKEKRKDFEIPKDYRIDGIYSSRQKGSTIKFLDIENHYAIVIGGSGATDKVVNHELYHIKNHHGEKFADSKLLKEIVYLFYEEPSAIFHTLTH